MKYGSMAVYVRPDPELRDVIVEMVWVMDLVKAMRLWLGSILFGCLHREGTRPRAKGRVARAPKGTMVAPLRAWPWFVYFYVCMSLRPLNNNEQCLLEGSDAD